MRFLVAIFQTLARKPPSRQAGRAACSRSHVKRAHLLLGVLLATAVTVPTARHGGFDPSSRSLFIVLAGAALVVAGAIDGRAAVDAVRSPLALTLFALAALSIVSVGWSIASRVSALRWGLVIGSYGAVFVVAVVLARAAGPRPVAAGIAVLAMGEAILGLRAVAFHSLPDAERLSGVWQPGGTFEYTPALTILQVGALPILSSAADRGGNVVAGTAAAAAVLAGACLGLTGSRLAPALAAVLLVALVLHPPPGRHARSAALAIAAFVAIGALLAPVMLGGTVGPHTPGTRLTGASYMAALAATAAVAWPLVRRLSNPAARSSSAAAAVAAIALVAIGSATTQSRAHPAHGPETNRTALRQTTTLRPLRQDVIRADHPSDKSPLHGRGTKWEAAIDTWLDRPLTGAGAGAYFVASLPHQSLPHSRFAHNLPLELAAELGILGLLLGLSLYGSTAWTILRAHAHPRWILAPTVALFMIANLVDWPWHLAGLGAIWAAASGALSAATD